MRGVENKVLNLQKWAKTGICQGFTKVLALMINLALLNAFLGFDEQF
jgi:hypothetical protein